MGVVIGYAVLRLLLPLENVSRCEVFLEWLYFGLKFILVESLVVKHLIRHSDLFLHVQSC